MRRLLVLPPLSALLVAVLPAVSEEGDLYASAVRIVQDRYLWPETLDAPSMLRGAVERLEDEVDWLVARPDGEGFLLEDGDGRTIARVEAGRLPDLPEALRTLERSVASAPWPLDPDLQLDVEILRGVVSGLDRPTTVLAGRRLSRFDERIRGTLEGIGARIGLEGGVLVVRQVFPGSPADEGGLRDGDLLLRIDGVSTLGMAAADATERIRGPVGSTVSLEVDRAGRTRVVRLVRREVSIPNLEERVLPGGAAYIRISHFSEQTVAHLRLALASLTSRHVLERGLVLDLRGNSGGSMIQAAHSADLFLVKGRLLRTVGRDGAAVSDLVREMVARDEGTEPPVPLVVLTDRHSASASEILAGSLVLLDRAVILGERTFGKGTVQKIFVLRPDVRLKLTVAEYRLANDRSVADDGLVPDVPTGRVVFDGHGVRWDAAEGDLAFVEVRSGWSEEDASTPSDHDPLVDLADRVLERSRGPHRDDVRAAAGEVAEAVRVEQDALLVRTFARQGIDWSPAPGPGPAPEVAVTLAPDTPPRAGDRLVLRVRLENHGPEALHRVRVILRSENPLWNGLILPIGRVASGREGEGRRTVRIPATLPVRTDAVALVVEADGRPVSTADPTTLSVEARPVPALAVRARAVALPGSAVHRVGLTIVNRGAEELHGIRTRFEFPEDEGVELVDREALVERLPPGGEARVALDVQVQDSVTGGAIPLVLRVDADEYGRILQWDLPVTLDGRESIHEAPVVRVRIPARAPAGTPVAVDLAATDDEEVDHACVYLNGRKVAFVRGERREMAARIEVVPEPGANAVVVRAEDRAGRPGVASVWVLGLGGDALPAVAGPPEAEADGDPDEETAP